jgi:hypothetical protein
VNERVGFNAGLNVDLDQGTVTPFGDLHCSIPVIKDNEYVQGCQLNINQRRVSLMSKFHVPLGKLSFKGQIGPLYNFNTGKVSACFGKEDGVVFSLGFFLFSKTLLTLHSFPFASILGKIETGCHTGTCEYQARAGGRLPVRKARKFPIYRHPRSILKGAWCYE